MKKKNLVTLVMGTIGELLFAIGMCMCLLPRWNVFSQGVGIGAVGAVFLIVMLLVRRKMEGKPAIRLSGRAVGTAALGVVGVLGLGIGMCLVTVWSMMLPGILIGIVGILLLLGLIPLCRGLTE